MNCFCDLKIFSNFESFSRSLEQFIQTVKGQNNFGNRMPFQLVPGGFSDLINQNNYNSDWNKIFGFINLHEKLENIIC